MTIRLAISVFLAFLSMCAIAGPSKQELCNNVREDRAIYLKYPDMAPYAPPTSNIPSPFSYDTPLDKLSSVKIASMFSGYYCDSPNNHPLIYASSSGYTVIGVGFDKTYPANKFYEAMDAYKKLLVSAGYSVD